VEVAGREVLGNAIALNSAMFNTARIIGPSIGGLVLAAVGTAACFFINSASFLAVIAALIAMKGLFYRPMSSRNKGLKDLVDGLRYVAGHGDISIILVLTATYSLFGTYYATLLPAFARDIYGKSETGYGMLISCLGLGALIGALFMAATSRSARQERWMVFGMALLVTALLALSMVTNYIVAAAVIVIQGFGMISFLVTGNILVQHLSDARYQGRTMAARHFVFGGMWTFGSLIAGYLAKYIGPRLTVASGAVVLLVVFVLVTPRVLKIDIRHLTAVPQSPGPPPQA
jgi:predicted MFS family arabinose efflux permease